MKRWLILMLTCCTAAGAGCSGITVGAYSRFDRGRRLESIAVIAHNQTKADRYQMWAWTKKRPRVVPVDNFQEQICSSLAAKTSLRILPPEAVNDALGKLGLEGRSVLSREEMREFAGLTGADAILFADVTFYLQNYLFYKTFGVTEITMRLVGLPDGNLLWGEKGRNIALFITTDSSLDKMRDKMLLQLAKKLEGDRAMAVAM